MKRVGILFILILILILYLNSPVIDDTFNSYELTSSKGENIYINSLNWGVTGDYQITVISNDKERLKKRNDTIGAIKGLNPFIYYFKNDSLKLYYKDEITYRINSNFKTIKVSYFILDSEEYYALMQNIDFHSVPR